MEVVMHRMIVPTVAMEMHILTEEISVINNQRKAGRECGKMIMTIIISALVFFIVLFLLRALLPLAVIIIAAVLIVRLIRG